MSAMWKNYLWMSFAADNKSRGVIISDIMDIEEALLETWRLNINPSGEIKFWEISSKSIDKSHLWKLLSKKQLKKYGYIK